MARFLFRVPYEAAGARLDRVLAERPEIASRAEAERLLAGGLVEVEGARRAKSHRLEGGEEVAVELPDPARLEPESIVTTHLYVDHLVASAAREAA